MRISRSFNIHSILSVIVAVLCLMFSSALCSVYSQNMSFERQRGADMLENIKNDLKKNYYDATFHSMDIDARFKVSSEKIKEATSVGQILGIIAQTLIDLNDSHTFFLPPSRASRIDYGWQMQIIGDKCYVVAVKPGSDAEAKGLKAGDEVYSIDGFGPTRETLWKMKYFYYTLRPRAGMHVILRDPGDKARELDVMAKVKQGKKVMDISGGGNGSDIWELVREAENEDRLRRQRYIELGDDLMIWKMPEFDLSDQGVDDMMSKASKRKALILDLRGNPGGAVTTLQRLMGYFFDKDLKIADLKGRKELKPMMAKTRGDKVFKGQLVVLIDSQSASAAEIFSRVVQLEKRGTVIGDRSSGAVMRSRVYDHQVGTDTVVFYATSITDADVIMSDGQSVERVGVTPDELILPTAADLLAKRDPALSRAAALVGVKLEPEKAGALFPIEWQK
jgi:C-terminal processing protease CtpA/Prc